MAAAHSDYTSGVVRVEVPVPRGTTALRWLMGQHSAGTGDVGASSLGAAPLVYFSGRHSSAPDTPLAARAEAATKGWFAVSGESELACMA